MRTRPARRRQHLTEPPGVTVTRSDSDVSRAAHQAVSPLANVQAQAHLQASHTSAPWAFQPHPAAWCAVAVALAALVILLRRSHTWTGARTTPKQWLAMAGGLLCLAVAVTWPVADVAAHWSLTALLVQRLLLTLGAAPLLLISLPTPLLGRLTRPRVIDTIMEALTRPVVALVTFTVIAVGTLASPAVDAQSSSVLAHAGIDVLLLGGGFVLWGPVLRHIPGANHPTPLGTAVYLFLQSIVPTFPAVIYIFSNRVLYHSFAGAHRAIGISALGDQHLAGIVAKVATLPVLWSVAWVLLTRAQTAEANERDPTPLTWAEVERQLERAERAERAAQRGHSHRRSARVRAIPRPVAGGWSTAPQLQWRPGAPPDDEAIGGGFGGSHGGTDRSPPDRPASPDRPARPDQSRRTRSPRSLGARSGRGWSSG